MTKKKLIIAHVPYIHRGGEDVHIEFLSRAYRELGYDVLFYPPRMAAKSQLVPAIRSFSPGVDLDFLEFFQNSGASFIHLHNAFPILGPKFFKTVVEHGLKMIMTVHNHRFFCTNGLALRSGKVCKDCFSDREKGNLAWKPLARNCNSDPVKSGYHSLAMSEMNRNDLYRKAVKVFLAPSPYIQSELVRWGVDEKNVEWLMNPITESKPPAGVSSRIEDCDVFYAGRLSEEKGILNLLQVVRSMPAMKFRIAGDGPLKALVLYAQKRNSNLKYFSDFSHDEVMLQIGKSKTGILASVCNEILPTFVLECFSMAKPCVIPNLDSTRWLDSVASEGKWFGISADTSSPEALIEAIQKALKSKAIGDLQVQEAKKQIEFEVFKTKLDSIVQKRIFS